MKDSYSLWTMRKQFTLQTAMTGFLTHCMFLNTRPPKMLISRETGYIGLAESSISAYFFLFSTNTLNSILPMYPTALNTSSPVLQQNDVTPFRLTPNVQDFITPTGIEGLMTAALLSLARGLLEPEVRVSMMNWHFSKGSRRSPGHPV